MLWSVVVANSIHMCQMPSATYEYNWLYHNSGASVKVYRGGGVRNCVLPGGKSIENTWNFWKANFSLPNILCIYTCIYSLGSIQTYFTAFVKKREHVPCKHINFTTMYASIHVGVPCFQCTCSRVLYMYIYRS